MFASIEALIKAISLGKMVVMVDDPVRENEGDLIMSAELARTEDINFMLHFGRGLICLPLTKQHCRQLELSPMVADNQLPLATQFMVSIEARHGVTTGISAADRAHTIRVAAQKNAVAQDLRRPGHIFPLMAQDNGVLARAGHTEASVDIVRLAGLTPAAVICEILNEDGSLAKGKDLIAFCQRHQILLGSIADLIHYRQQQEAQ